MSQDLLKYNLASSTWGNEEKKAAIDTIQSEQITMGNKVKKFEEKFCNYFGAKYSVMVNSGSSANLLAVASLFYKKDKPIKKGDEVIVPAVSWSTTYYPLLQYGLKLKFVDIDLHTLNFNLEELERSISKNTRLIFAVNILGNPNEFDKIKNIIKDKDIYLLEDNCESMGATYKAKFTGTIGTIGTFSTYFSHHINTIEGGMITTDDEEIYHLILSLRSHGWTRHLPNSNKLVAKSKNSFNESFRFILPGYNLRPTEISAAIGVEQLKKLKKFISTRRENAKYFIQNFKDDERVILQKEISRSSWFGFSIILKDINREKILKELDKNNIEFRPIVSGNFVKNEVMKYFDYKTQSKLINANYLHENGFFIGNHHYLLYDQIDLLKKIFSNV